MNWSKAKNILIVLFVFADIFLLSVLLIISDGIKKTPDGIAETAVRLAAKNGINISPELLKTNISKVHIPELLNVAYDEDEFARTVLGDDAEKNNGVYTGKNGELTVDGHTFSFLGEISVSSRNSAAVSARVFSLLDIKDKDFVCTVSDKDGIRELIITKKSGGMNFFCCSLSVVLSGNSIQKITGSWFTETGKYSEETQLKPIAGILIDAASVNDGTQKNAASVSEGYMLPDNYLSESKFFPTPCVCFNFSDGSKTYLPSAENEIF